MTKDAVDSGKWLEELVIGTLCPMGFLLAEHRAVQDNIDMFSGRRLIRHAPYRSIYYDFALNPARESITEFVIDNFGHLTRLECKNQEVSGSCDEKLPYVFENFKKMSEPAGVLLLGGEGWKDGVVGWCKYAATQIRGKTIWVLNPNNFRSWAREQYPRADAA